MTITGYMIHGTEVPGTAHSKCSAEPCGHTSLPPQGSQIASSQTLVPLPTGPGRNGQAVSWTQLGALGRRGGPSGGGPQPRGALPVSWEPPGHVPLPKSCYLGTNWQAHQAFILWLTGC